MAYKESNPAKVHIVQFIILLSFLLLFHVVYALGAMNIFIATATDNYDMMMPLFAIGYGLSCFFPYVPIYFIVVYSMSLIRRGVYGEQHSRATIQGFFFGILGMVVPPILALMSFMFIELVEKVYVIMPIFLHLIPISMLFGTYLFVKDIGGRTRGTIGILVIAISSVFLMMIEVVALMIVEDMTDGTASLLSLSAMFISICTVIGIVFMIMAFVDANKWTNQHRPLMDTQQKQQLEMQQNQIRMQQKQLEMQYQQLEMQKQSMEMLSDVRQEVIEGGRSLIPERTEEPKGQNKAPPEYRK